MYPNISISEQSLKLHINLTFLHGMRTTDFLPFISYNRIMFAARKAFLCMSMCFQIDVLYETMALLYFVPRTKKQTKRQETGSKAVEQAGLRKQGGFQKQGSD